MCGIVGYVGKKLPIVSLLIKGLEDLEYRGYDSAGVVFVSDGELKVVKNKGKVSELAGRLKEKGFLDFEGNIGMGHTRWATHGAPTSYNAHPIVDNEGKFAVVHNGIIENFLELKRELKSDGYDFYTETDTEVIVYLVKKYYDGDIFNTVRKVVGRLRGAFAIGVMSVYEPDRIVLARWGSPLVVGLGEDGNYFASDATPLLRYTRKAVFLDDGTMAVVSRKGAEFVDQEGMLIKPRVVNVDWTPEMASKGGFEHYMLKEIKEEGRVVRESLEGRVTSDRISLLEVADVNIDDIRRIFIVACGTSYYAGMIGKYLFEEMLDVPAEVEIASEIRYRKFPVDKNDIAIVISQSGETADTLAALRLFKQKGMRVIALVNVRGSTIDRESDISIYLRAGPEIGVASTKAFVAQIMVLYLMVLQWVQQKGKNLDIKQYATAMLKLPYQIEEVFSREDEIKRLAKKYHVFTNFLYLGRWIYFPIALEGALKLKEISYIHAEGYPAGEMKHGPIALIDENMPVVAIIPEGYIYKKMLNNLEEATARKAPIIAVTTIGNEAIKRYTEDIIWIPKAEEIFMPLLSIVPLQLFAYYMAYLRGCEIDQPRNLAKSVTVE